MWNFFKLITNKFIYRTEVEPGEILPLIIKENPVLPADKNFAALPAEIRAYIFSFLEKKEVGAARAANQTMKNAIDTSKLQFSYVNENYQTQICSTEYVYTLLKASQEKKLQQLKSEKSQLDTSTTCGVGLVITGICAMGGSVGVGIGTSAKLIASMGLLKAGCIGCAAGTSGVGISTGLVLLGGKLASSASEKAVIIRQEKKQLKKYLKADKPNIQMMRMR
jgi:hypothetical protein